MPDTNEQRDRPRWRTTVVIEATCEEDFEWALSHAIELARSRVIQMSFSKQGDPLTRYSVRTARMRNKKRE